MKNILILNFGTTHDLIASSHFIGALKEESPKANIELVTLKENMDITEILSNVNNVHFIDSAMVKSLIENPLYSDAFALNEFTQSIENVANTNWDQVINYSNDDFSAFFAKALSTQEIIGTYIDERGMPACSDKWSIFQNYTLASCTRQSIDKVVTRNHMLNMPMRRDIEKFKNHPDYAIAASQNFARIRQMKGATGTFIVGLNLEAGYDGYAPTVETLTELIEAMEDSQDYKPVLLLSGKNYQREMANKLNQTFNNSLISINIDYVALPSVIANLDAIVSASSDQLAIADSMDTKCIEIREDHGLKRNPTVTTPDNYTIFINSPKTTASDILLALNEEFGTELPISCMTSNNPTYKVVTDDYGHLYTQIRGALDVQNELRYHTERSIFYNLMGYPENTDLFDHIRDNTDPEQVLNYVGNLKGDLTATVKMLLATLRSLKGVKNSQSNLNSFISYLDNLILSGKQDSLVGSIIRNFEGRIENINADDIDANIKAIETNLFKLKSELQIVTNMMTTLTTNKTVTEKVTGDIIDSANPNQVDA